MTHDEVHERGGTAWWPLDEGCDDHYFVWSVVQRHLGGPDWSVLEVKARDFIVPSGDADGLIEIEHGRHGTVRSAPPHP